LQEEDAEYANRKGFSKHRPALPLYTYNDAVASLDRFRAVDESKPLHVPEHFGLRYFPAGHILGARSILVEIRDQGGLRRVLFSGDVGREQQLVIRLHGPVPPSPRGPQPGNGRARAAQD